MAIATGVICLSFVLFANGYMVAPSHRLSWHQRQSQGTSAQSSWLLLLLRSTSTDRIEDEFASFAATLEEEPKTTNANVKSWQTDLEQLLLDPKISLAQRQVLISDLMNANAEIRESVNTAIRERKIDPLLTPTGRKLQDGTRAVARQIRTDILPSLTNPPTATSKNGDTDGLFTPPAVPLPKPPNPEDVTRIGNRLFNTISNQIQRNIETFQSDLMNPSRIPERIAKQAEEMMQEASNVFSETPVGLQEPPYTVVLTAGTEYEIRDYPEYTVATTTMTDSRLSESDAASSSPLIVSSLTDQGVAFNTLASYIFGSNAENRVLDMTTPVTTTMSGEMRFYIPDAVVPPEPLRQDATTTTTALYDANPGNGKIRLERLPAARLAVRRFTGFCTPGEILRQKEALLSALALDPNVEVDVPHGQTVGHIVLQYNPPYTLPVIRRNEIAVPVTILSMEEDEE